MKDKELSLSLRESCSNMLNTFDSRMQQLLIRHKPSIYLNDHLTKKHIFLKNKRLQSQIKEKLKAINRNIYMMTALIKNRSAIKQHKIRPHLIGKVTICKRNETDRKVLPKRIVGSPYTKINTDRRCWLNKPTTSTVILSQVENETNNTQNIKAKEHLQQPEQVVSVETLEPAKDKTVYNVIHYDTEMHWCYVCNVFPKNAKDYLCHLHSKEHKKIVLNKHIIESPWHTNESDKPTEFNKGFPVKRKPIQGLQFFIPTTAWYCKLCSTWIGDLHCAANHLKSDLHSQKYSEYLEENPHWEIDWILGRTRAYEEFVKSNYQSDVNKVIKEEYHSPSTSTAVTETTYAAIDCKMIKEEAKSSSDELCCSSSTIFSDKSQYISEVINKTLHSRRSEIYQRKNEIYSRRYETGRKRESKIYERRNEINLRKRSNSRIREVYWYGNEKSSSRSEESFKSEKNCRKREESFKRERQFGTRKESLKRERSIEDSVRREIIPKSSEVTGKVKKLDQERINRIARKYKKYTWKQRKKLDRLKKESDQIRTAKIIQRNNLRNISKNLSKNINKMRPIDIEDATKSRKNVKSRKISDVHYKSDGECTSSNFEEDNELPLVSLNCTEDLTCASSLRKGIDKSAKAYDLDKIYTSKQVEQKEITPSSDSSSNALISEKALLEKLSFDYNLSTFEMKDTGKMLSDRLQIKSLSLLVLSKIESMRSDPKCLKIMNNILKSQTYLKLNSCINSDQLESQLPVSFKVESCKTL